MKKVLALAIAGAFAVPATAGAAPSEMKVTGGGKTADGFTIALTAQGNPTLGKGQVQYNQHDGVVKEHGTVKCVFTGLIDHDDDADTAPLNGYEISGTLRSGGFFNVKGTDAGQPKEANSDTVVFGKTDEQEDCDGEPNEAYDGLPPLASGNIKIHKTNPGYAKKQQRTDMRAAKRTANAAQFNAAAFATGLALTSLL